MISETQQLIIQNHIKKSHQAVKDAELLLQSHSFIGALNKI
jgi:hypothetical protein